MALKNLHNWDLSPSQAIALQKELASHVVTEGDACGVQLVAGCDISVPRFGKNARAAIVVLSYPSLEIVEVAKGYAELGMPYIPGLLSFREAPLILDLYDKLSVRPDILFVDGQGVAHPRRLGIAAHLGLWLDIPTKSRLCVEHGEVGAESGSRAELCDKGELIGTVLRTRAGSKPLYISPGHKIGFDEAVGWVLACNRCYRLPEPTRLAHLAAGGNLPHQPGVVSPALS